MLAAMLERTVAGTVLVGSVRWAGNLLGGPVANKTMGSYEHNAE
jgi:hypothetical protein